MLHQRFEADFESACASLQLQAQVSLEEMTKLLLLLGFLTPLKSEQAVVSFLWKLVGGDSEASNSVPLLACKNCLRAVQKFQHQSSMDTQRPKSYQGFGRMEDCALLFTVQEIEILS
jgi:hypothetical protein